MTDIRKEFEKSCINLDLNFFRNKDDDEHYWYPETQKAFDAYQAGRAHDVDGLIARIGGLQHAYKANCHDKYSAEEVNGKIVGVVKSTQEIIRKHFGKE